jgi:hypothetical protein
MTLPGASARTSRNPIRLLFDMVATPLATP